MTESVREYSTSTSCLSSLEFEKYKSLGGERE